MQTPLPSRVRLQTLVFPTDDSPAAEAARPLAERLARRHGATLHVLRVDVVAPADLRVDAVSVRTTGGVVEARRRHPAAAYAIVDYASEVEADLIVMGTHGRSGFDRLALGSTAEVVLRRAPCPVLTVRPDADLDAAGPLLVPLAFESASDVALETAVALAEADGTGVVALHVVEPVEIPVPYAMTIEPFDLTDLTARVEETLRHWVSAYAEGPVPVTPEVRHGGAAVRVLDAAEEHGARLLVQASHGRRGVGRWLLGSVAEEVARRAPCPVLTLRVGVRRLVRTDGGSDLAVPRADWPALFDALSARAAAAPHEVTVEVVSPEARGLVFRSAPLVGLTYDARHQALDVIAEGGGHHVVRPFAVRSAAGAWALDGARAVEASEPWVLDVVAADGGRQRITVGPVLQPTPAAEAAVPS